MKPDSDSHKFMAGWFTENPPVLNKINNLSVVKIKPRQKPKPSLSKTLAQQVDDISRQQWVSDAAYYKAEARGFIPGYEVADWLAAEQEFIEMLVDLFLSVFREDGSMTMTGLQQLATAIGVSKPERIDSKLKLIRLIQLSSRHRPCFRTKPGEFCKDQAGCQWSGECQKMVAEWWR
jgi:Protein of unknown function (DUF2934)